MFSNYVAVGDSSELIQMVIFFDCRSVRCDFIIEAHKGTMWQYLDPSYSTVLTSGHRCARVGRSGSSGGERVQVAESDEWLRQCKGIMKSR